MSWFSKRIAIFTAAAVLAVPVFADTVTLTNDKVLEGHVTENGDTVVVELPQGTIRLKRAQIKSIVKKDTPLEEFGRRAAELQKKVKDGELEMLDQIKAWSELARWASDQQLPRDRDEAYKKVIELDPDNAAAREALGYVLMQGKWMTATERNVALGVVRYEGRWITKEALADIKSARDKQSAQQAESERAQADAELKDAQIQKLQAERDLLNAQRDQLRQQYAQQQEVQPLYVPVPVPVYSTVPYAPRNPRGDGLITQPTTGRPAYSTPNMLPGLGVPNLNYPNLHPALPTAPIGLPTPNPSLATPGKLPAPTTPPSQILQPNTNTPALPAPGNRAIATDTIPVDAATSTAR